MLVVLLYIINEYWVETLCATPQKNRVKTKVSDPAGSLFPRSILAKRHLPKLNTWRSRKSRLDSSHWGDALRIWHRKMHLYGTNMSVISKNTDSWVWSHIYQVTPWKKHVSKTRQQPRYSAKYANCRIFGHQNNNHTKKVGAKLTRKNKNKNSLKTPR